MFSADPFGQLKKLQNVFSRSVRTAKQKAKKHQVFRTAQLGVRANAELGVGSNAELGVRANAELGVIANVRTLQRICKQTARIQILCRLFVPIKVICRYAIAGGGPADKMLNYDK